MRLIDADKMHRDLDTMAETYEGSLGDTAAMRLLCRFAQKQLDNQETIDPVGHGHWVIKNQVIDLNGLKIAGDYPTCSVCGEMQTGVHQYSVYCPECGAKMDKVTTGK